MKFTKHTYPDKGSYISIEDTSEPHKIIYPINSYEDLFMLKSLKDASQNAGIKNLEIVIPCMFQQQHDRRFNKNESFELKLVCNFINSCKFKKVHIELTNICNLKCSFCPPKLFPNKIMDLNTFDRLNFELKDITNELAYHIVGDPLV